MITFDDIHLTYRAHDREVEALAGVSLQLADGEALAVLGANGSGKSTLALLANGLLHPDTGSVLVDGIDTRDLARAFDVRSAVGLVLQDPEDQIVATSVLEEVAFGPENLGLPRELLRERVSAAIDAVGLAGLERREPHTLSGGQKQRLAIAGALAMRPRHLVLDEPTSMLDPAGREDVIAVLEGMRSQGVAVLMVTHRVEDVAFANRVAVLAGGRVDWCGTYDELLSEPERLAAWGLTPPATSRLASAMIRAGADLPPGAHRSTASLVSALCR